MPDFAAAAAACVRSLGIVSGRIVCVLGSVRNFELARMKVAWREAHWNCTLSQVAAGIPVPPPPPQVFDQKMPLPMPWLALVCVSKPFASCLGSMRSGPLGVEYDI